MKLGSKYYPLYKHLKNCIQEAIGRTPGMKPFIGFSMSGVNLPPKALVFSPDGKICPDTLI